MEEEALRRYLAQISISKDILPNSEAYISYDMAKNQNKCALFISDTKAYINIAGILKPDFSLMDYYSGSQVVQYHHILETIDMVSGNKNLKKIYLLINSPGGAISGLDETYQAFCELSKKKKLTSVNQDMMTSAAYYLGMAAENIIAQSPLAMTGSIGVKATFVDFSKMLEKEGIKKIEIISKNAPLKSADPASKKGYDQIQEYLNSAERVFINRVSESRKYDKDYIIKNFGKGGFMIAADPDPEKPDALSVGLIDGYYNQNNKLITKDKYIEV
jgi:ClpP class serine protease